ncbi:hypothetical protein [Dyadobacter sp. 32]
MKTINLHATTTKKSYRKPVLKKIGKVKNLTHKGGSITDGLSGTDEVP